MTARHPDLAYVAIVACWILLLLVTIAGRIQGDNWNTISDMITRSPRLRNAFAVIVGWIVVCQLYYVTVMCRRWSKIVHAQARAAPHMTPRPLYWPLTFISIGAVASAAGSVGFAIISTDISTTQHEYCAVAAFLGIYMYLCAFAWLGYTFGDKHILSLHAAWTMLAVPIICLLYFGISVQLDAAVTDYLYVCEFVFVTSAFGAACALYTFPVDADRVLAPRTTGFAAARAAEDSSGKQHGLLLF